jgi:hypothetical protein
MAQHPLEPLSGDEFRQTASIMRREGLVRDTFRFASIELKEPPKSEVKAWRPGDFLGRHARSQAVQIAPTGRRVPAITACPRITWLPVEIISVLRARSHRFEPSCAHWRIFTFSGSLTIVWLSCRSPELV